MSKRIEDMLNYIFKYYKDNYDWYFLSNEPDITLKLDLIRDNLEKKLYAINIIDKKYDEIIAKAIPIKWIEEELFNLRLNKIKEELNKIRDNIDGKIKANINAISNIKEEQDKAIKEISRQFEQTKNSLESLSKKDENNKLEFQNKVNSTREELIAKLIQLKDRLKLLENNNRSIISRPEYKELKQELLSELNNSKEE